MVAQLRLLRGELGCHVAELEPYADRLKERVRAPPPGRYSSRQGWQTARGPRGPQQATATAGGA